jgi:hypothetical protein
VIRISGVREPRWIFGFGVAALVVAMTTLLWMASNARAAETIYWDNYRAEPGTVSYSNLDGTGGGALNLSGITLEHPEGMTFDSATGRLYVASSSGGATKKGEIVFAGVDGSGADVLPTPGAEVNEPYGVAIDPATRIIYWTNGGGGPGGEGSIAFARLDGSGGGLLNTTGVTVSEPYRLAIDPTSGRVFWDNGNGPATDALAFANLNNSGGGGTLPLPATPGSLYGIGVDSAAGRVYWLDSTPGKEKLLFENVNGSGGGEVGLAGSTLINGYGLAIDPSIGRIYWGNYGFSGSVPQAIGFVNLAGGGGSITPVSAPVNGAQDPVVLKSPSGTGAPAVTRSKTSRSVLSCSQGAWAADLPGAFVYQAPQAYGYQWTRNGKAVSGGTEPTLKTKSAGSYACVVTAANHVGPASQTSAAVTVKAAKLKLTVKKNGKAHTGGLAKFTVKAVNQGDLKSKSARICVKVPKSARKDLKAPKCRKLSQLGGHKKGSARLKVRLSDSAGGTYGLTFLVRGTAGKSAKVKLRVS